MEYCGLTMKRQLYMKEYEVKDWVQNAVGLAEAYLSKERFSQAEYLLYAAYHIIPDEGKEAEKWAEQKAMVQRQLGTYY